MITNLPYEITLGLKNKKVYFLYCQKEQNNILMNIGKNLWQQNKFTRIYLKSPMYSSF